jgi:uncharacterized ion transporter superfamily protein YfcC
MDESIDTLDRAFELLKAPVAGMDFDLSKKRVEELMMSELSKSRSRSLRKPLLAAIVVLFVLIAGGAVAATTGAWNSVIVELFIDVPDGQEIQSISTEFQYTE